MAFMCKKCHVQPCWPFGVGLGLSYGPCEECGKVAACADCWCTPKPKDSTRPEPRDETKEGT